MKPELVISVMMLGTEAAREQMMDAFSTSSPLLLWVKAILRIVIWILSRASFTSVRLMP